MIQNSKLIGKGIFKKNKNDSNLQAIPLWLGMLTVDDTELAVTDRGGPGVAVVYLNGQFATQIYWDKVIANLGAGFRHITYDERGRGKKSKTSADYSFARCVDDVDKVLYARNIKKCVIVGWSYGAFVAAHWASRNPDRCLGAVLVDGAQPYDWMTNEMEKRIRKLFKQLRFVMWLMRPTGLTPRIPASKMAEINIELGWLAQVKELSPILDKITAPTRYVLASGTSFGSKGDEQEQIRSGINAVLRRNPNIKLSAKVPSNHGAILKKDFRAVADAIREVSALGNNK